MATGRTGVVPWAGRLSFTTDADVLVEGDAVELLRDNAVEWSGRVREKSQATDQQLNALRWQFTAQGRLAELIAVEAGAATQRYDDITIATAFEHLLDAVGIGAALRDIGPSSRRLAYWQLLADQTPWAEARRLLITAGPRARLFEDRAGRIVFRDLDVPALSRTLYGRAEGRGDRPIITRIENEDVGRDRVVNVARVPYIVTPDPAPAVVQSSDWGLVDLAGNPLRAVIDSEIPAMTEQLVIAGYGTFADGRAGGAPPTPEPVRPEWNRLYGQTWQSDYGSSVDGEQSVTITTGDVTATGIAESGNNFTTTTASSLVSFIRLSTRGTLRLTASAAASATVSIPQGATDVRVSVTAIEMRRFVITYQGGPRLTRRIDTLSALDANTFFTVARNGNTITVTPRAQTTSIPGSTFPRASNQSRPTAGKFTVTVRVSWRVGVIETAWSGLYAGLATNQVEAALDAPTVENVTVRRAVNVLRLSIAGGIRPRRVNPGDAVLRGTLLVSACVVESRIDAAVAITPPAGWIQVAGAPSGLDTANTRRILFVATRTVAADGVVPAASWTATGPTDPVVRAVTFAAGPHRAVVWEDDAQMRAVNGPGTYPLRVGRNTIKLTVTAQDGVTTQTYTVVVNRGAT